ncbi:hypothetical protein [Conyzicola sp.]|uniref:hypothetical protein n=1 Tax=Conyzicola sp. TaxID=1969404 RepID=UPI0039898BDE
MTARSDDDFDPRFDPAFQRGFDASSSPETPRVVQRDVRRATPVRPPEPTAAPGQPYDSAPAIGLPPAHTDPLAVDSGQADAAAHDDQPRRNPFLITLGVVSVALVAAGVWGIQAAREPFLGTDAASTIDYVGLQILQILSPVSIALGVATAIGILFVYAVGAQRRR